MSILDLLNRSKDKDYNIGKLFMDCMTSKPPDGICQIDASTGEEETYLSVLARSIRLAKAIRALGLQPGDVMAIGGRNHLDLHIPYYAALLNGLPIVGVDPYYKYDEIKSLFKLTEPKIAFCQHETYNDYTKAAEDLGIDVSVFTFDGDECSMSNFIEKYDDKQPLHDFQVADFGTEVFAWLISTSGSTGVPKVAAFKHRPLIDQMRTVIDMMKRTQTQDSNPRCALHLAPVQWISSYFNAIGMIISNNCKLQTSNPDSIGHVIDIINKYKPVSVMLGPSTLSLILKHEKECDLSCFNVITLTGAKVYKELLADVKSRLRPDAFVMEAYGQTETLGPVLRPNPMGPIGCCGVASPITEIKLVDSDTGKDITEPMVPGELWAKGPCLMTEYYNNPEETAKVFTEDGWYKTGDLLCKDEDGNYFFVDRIKMLIKYRSYHVNPPELEEVISTHEGVQEVSVVGLSDPQDGQRPAACVVRRPDSDVTAQEIKDIVADKLSASKQLRGGVIFLDELPKTSTGKIARVKLNEIIINARIE